MQAGTYWLTRSSGGDELQLFDITEMAVDDANAETADKDTAAKDTAAKDTADKDTVGKQAADTEEAEQEAAEAAAAAETAAAKAAAAVEKEASAETAETGNGVAPAATSVAASAAAAASNAEATASPGSTAAQDDARSGPKAASPGTARRAPTVRPFALPVALLCWRIAEQLTAAHEVLRRRRLLETCVSLLRDGGGSSQSRQQMPMAAAAHEGLADIALHLAHARLPLPADGGGDAAIQSDDDTLTDQACSAIADPILSAACKCSPRRPSPRRHAARSPSTVRLSARSSRASVPFAASAGPARRRRASCVCSRSSAAN
jgi:hypothetical protein